ncbi:GATA transcription factor 29 [Linum grandiflorum]
MKNLDLNLKLSLPCNAYDTNDVSNATPNNFDSESVQPTCDSSSPRAIIPQGGIGSSARVNQQYGYGVPTFGMVNHEYPNNITPGMPWMIPTQQPTTNNNPTSTTVVGVPAAAIYMNQMEFMSNKPVLQQAPPNIPDDKDKKCLLCKTCKTPMWRRGPLGAKTLCNACGLKFKKEVQKKMEREGSTTGSK